MRARALACIDLARQQTAIRAVRVLQGRARPPGALRRAVDEVAQAVRVGLGVVHLAVGGGVGVGQQVGQPALGAAAVGQVALGREGVEAL